MIPSFYVERVRRELGPFYRHLPPDALRHDPNAYLHASAESGTSLHAISAEPPRSAR